MSVLKTTIHRSTTTTTIYESPGYPIDPTRDRIEQYQCIIESMTPETVLHAEPRPRMAFQDFLDELFRQESNAWQMRIREAHQSVFRNFDGSGLGLLPEEENQFGIATVDMVHENGRRTKQPIISFADSHGYFRRSTYRHFLWKNWIAENPLQKR